MSTLLPPLFLTEVIDKCAADHPESDMVPTIVKVSAGYGRHAHTRDYASPCYRDCDDSDWIVELQYSTHGWHAIYGVKRHGDVQDVQLWMD